MSSAHSPRNTVSKNVIEASPTELRRWPCHYLYDDGLITLSMQLGPISLFGELPRARKVCQRRLAASFRLTS
jgi:hypothetical protein